LFEASLQFLFLFEPAIGLLPFNMTRERPDCSNLFQSRLMMEALEAQDHPGPFVVAFDEALGLLGCLGIIGANQRFVSDEMTIQPELGLVPSTEPSTNLLRADESGAPLNPMIRIGHGFPSGVKAGKMDGNS
jgi:hypothetical protein